MRRTAILVAASLAALLSLPWRPTRAEEEGAGESAIRAAEQLGTLRHAVVIGIDTYADKRVPPLTSREQDARAVLGVLQDPTRGGVPKAHVQALLGAEATTANVREALGRLKALPREATAFVYFAGHGAVVGEEAFWVTHDARHNRLPQTAIASSEVRKLLEQIPAERVLLVMNCCHVGKPVGDGVGDREAVLGGYRGPGHATLAASAAKEIRIGGADAGPSVFGHYVARGLAGKADEDDDGVVALNELATYVDRGVRARVLKLPGLERPVTDLESGVDPARFLLTIEPEAFAEYLADEVEARAESNARTKALTALADEGRIEAEQARDGLHWLAALPQGLLPYEQDLWTRYVDLVEKRLDPAHLAGALAALRRKDRKTLVVPEEFETIQAAIDAAQAGDTVFVKEGIYHEHVVFKTGLVLRGDGPERTLLRMVTGEREILLAKDCAWGLIESLQLDGTGGEKLGDWSPDGIHLQASAIRVRDCLAYRCLGGGLYASDPGCRPYVSGCTFEENTYDGAAFRGVDRATIVDCISRSNGAVGIQVREAHGPVTVRDNECVLCKHAGIGVCGGTEVTLVGNECRRNGGHGILAWDAKTSVTIRDNDCSLNEIVGIYLVQGASGTVSGNACERNREGGIVVSGAGSRGTILENRCLLNARAQSGALSGIVFAEGAEGEAASNTCEGNVWGILVTGNGTSARLRDNTCRSNRAGGIVVADTATATVTENACHENTRFGIQVTGSRTRADLVKNACRANGEDGIRFSEKAGGTADGNDCSENEAYGISAYGYGTRPTIRKNRCTKNGRAGIAKEEGASPVVADDNVESDNGER